MINKSFFEKFSPLLYQTGLREDDYTREFLGFKQQIERILATLYVDFVISLFLLAHNNNYLTILK